MSEASGESLDLASWGEAGVKLLRTMRLEAARSGHEAAQPAHLLLAALDQPEVHQALGAIGLRPDVYQVRRRLVAANLVPVEFSETAPFAPRVRALVAAVRPRREGEDSAIVYLLALKAALDDETCRSLMRRGAVDSAQLEAALSRLA